MCVFFVEENSNPSSGFSSINLVVMWKEFNLLASTEWFRCLRYYNFFNVVSSSHFLALYQEVRCVCAPFEQALVFFLWFWICFFGSTIFLIEHNCLHKIHYFFTVIGYIDVGVELLSNIIWNCIAAGIEKVLIGVGCNKISR